MSIKTTLKYSTGVLLTAGVLNVSAGVIDFDWTGTGSGVISNVASLDWKPGSSYTIGGVGGQLSDGDELDTYLHGSLGSFLDQNGQAITNNFGLNTDYEVTFVAGFREVVFGISDFVNPVTGEFIQSLNFASIADPINFFEIYIDYAVNSDPLAGTGFNDGTLIASGAVLPGGGGNITSTFVFSGDLTDPISTDPNDYDLMDQFGIDNWSDTKSNTGIGGSVFGTSADFVNEAFILPMDNGVIWNGIDFDISFNSSQTVPFRETNPSRQFIDENGNIIVADVGTINGITGTGPGQGVLLQIDGNSSFTTVAREVPEPNILLLFGAGLLGMFGLVRVRQRQS